MFNIPEIVITKVNKFVSDEIHIIGKQHKNPSAILTFVAEDDDGNKVSGAPVAVIKLEGKAFNQWYQNWSSEADLYSQMLNLIKNEVPGIQVQGVDLSKVGLNNISVPLKIEEILNEIPES